MLFLEEKIVIQHNPTSVTKAGGGSALGVSRFASRASCSSSATLRKGEGGLWNVL